MAEMQPEPTEPNDAPAVAATAAPVKDDAFAAKLRGFGPVGLIAIFVIYAGNALLAPLSAVLVLAWAWMSRTPWRGIGFGRPRNWLVVLAGGILLGVALKLTMKAVVMPLLGADPINHAFQYLAGNRAAIPMALYMMVVAAGFGEETMFRGYAFERLGKLLGTSVGAKAAIVLLTSTWFALEHYALQGVPGTQQALIVGLVFGTIYARTGQLWMLIVAHAAFDLTAYAIIYHQWETAVATFFFPAPA